MPVETDPRIGSVLNQTYRLDSVLGVGGMGTVYAAQHLLLQQQVAIKVLHQRVTDRRVALERFRREAQIAAQLGHPGLVAVRDFNFTDDGAPYMVMEYLAGQTLLERVGQGPLALPEVCAIFAQLCDALHAVHEAGIVHRDVKPENIILLRTDAQGRPLPPAAPPRVKLLDFGVSKILSSAQGLEAAAFTDREIVGTPSYLAPEQAAGSGQLVDRRADVFALGTILYECLTGQRAFDGPHPVAALRAMMTEPVPSLAERRPDLGAVLPALDEVLRLACAKDPHARCATAKELYQGLLLAAQPPESVATAPRAASSELDWNDGDTLFDAQAEVLQRAAASYGPAPTPAAESTAPRGVALPAPVVGLAPASKISPRGDSELTMADEGRRADPLPTADGPRPGPPVKRGPVPLERPTTILDTLATPPQGLVAPRWSMSKDATVDLSSLPVALTPAAPAPAASKGMGSTLLTALVAVLVGIVVGMVSLRLLSPAAGPSLVLEHTQQVEQLLGEGEEMVQAGRCNDAVQRASAVLLIDRKSARAREILRRCERR